jgi:hypothetical protein
MNRDGSLSFLYLMLFMIAIITETVMPQHLKLSAGGDLVSRYIWRGTNMNDQVNIQPYLTFAIGKIELGAWGSYGLSHLNSDDKDYALQAEIDTWLGLTFVDTKAINISAIFTDYFFPNNGKRFSNYNNYDNPDGPGAHTIEAGLILSGRDLLPLSIAGYTNIYNDKGRSSYFQADYTTVLNEFEIDLFVGAAKGNADNPDYYGTSKFAVINTGFKVSKSIHITNSFSLPVFFSYIVNPNTGLVYFVVGLSI